ncbi:MAG: hypothetical protein RMN24_04915 [Anaerolineae bacterium]|nr:hypothetical protein [Caldilineales bacterium]MCX7852000.1 hypothetical protein [Caldilineales bacterium]MDW8268488.1 hypothetical protein [Anaerolineae bacterium]
MTDYRSHLSVAIWAALVALVLGHIVTLPTRTFAALVFGSPVSIAITSRFLTGLVAVAIVCAGLEAAMRTHPHRERLRHTYRYWGLPGAVVMTAGALLPAAPSETWWLIGVVLTGVVLAAAMLGEYHVADHEDPAFHGARLLLNGLCYALAAVAFILIYSSRSRSLISATLIGSIGGLLALDLLRETSPRQLPVLLFGLVVTLTLSQLTWVLNYGPYTAIRVGLVLLVVFYLLVGLAHQQLLGHLTRRRTLEYITLAAAAIAILMGFPAA